MRHPQIYHHQYRLHSFDLDCYGHYPIARLVKLYIEVSGEHSAVLGIGEHDLLGDTYTWVLSRLSSVVYRPIDVRKPLDLETSLIRFDGLTALRPIRATQDEGRQLISTTMTQWAAIGYESRRPIPLAQVATPDQFDYLREGEWDVPTLPRHVIPTDAELGSVGEHLVRYSDLDINRHFNSFAWISTALNALPLEQLAQLPRRIDLHFIREALYGDTLRLLSAKGTEGEYFIRLQRKGDHPGFDLRLIF